MKAGNRIQQLRPASTLALAIAGLVFGAGLGAKSPIENARPYVQDVERISGAGDAPRNALGASLGAVSAPEQVGVPIGLYIVQLREPAVASYSGGIAGLQAPPRQGARLDARSPEALQYAAHLESRQASFVASLSQRFGSQLKTFESYQFALNAVVLKLDADQRKQVELDPRVSLVDPVVAVPTRTDVGPEFIGAEGIWNGTATGGAPGTEGEGVVVGILDSGVNWSNPSFAGTGGDGHVHTNPLGAGNYLGVCDTETPDPVNGPNCNEKVIGAWAKSFDFVQQVNFECANPGNPGNELGLTPATCTSLGVPLTDFDNALDENGHGSHTASTAAGNRTDITYQDIDFTVKGVAPHANLVIYDVCHTNTPGQGSCFNFASIGAAEQVIEDGIIDVINFSIGGGSQPWTDSVSQAFLNATNAGVVVVAAAGNSGPTAGSTSHVEPWVTTVANGTHTRALIGGSFISVTGPGTPPPALVNRQIFLGTAGSAQTTAIGPAPLTRSPGLETTSDGCAAFPAGTFTGAVAMIRRGTCAFGQKASNAQAAGAIAVVIANNQAGEVAPAADPNFPVTIPVFGANQVLANAIRDYAIANPGTTVSIPAPGGAQATQGDVLNNSSSRGPSTFDMLKPDIMAPGTNILAAVNGDADAYEQLSGTSMASPHVAGAAALVLAVNPDLTPTEVKSALMLTSKSSGLTKPDGVTSADPFDRGAGRVDLGKAAISGLVLNETGANLLAANPATGGTPGTLNLANLNSRECIGECSWTRTFRSVAAGTETYTASFVNSSGVTLDVQPSSFTIAPDETIELTITADVSAANFGTWNFGELVLTPAPAGQTTYIESAAGNIAIPDGQYVGGFNNATMACKAIDTTGDVPAAAVVVDVQLVATMAHPWIGDTAAKLASPANSILGIFSRPGENEPADDGDTDVVGDGSDFVATHPIRFADSGTVSAESMGTVPVLTTTQAVCRDGGSACTYSPEPGAIARPPANFAGFAGQPASGVWRFCMGDSFPADAGTLGNVTLELTYGTPVAVPALHLPLAVFAIEASAEIVVDPTSISESVVEGGAPVETIVTIDNPGTVGLNWSVFVPTGIETLWDQPVTDTNGIVSDFSTTQGGGAYTADDFVIGVTSSISSLTSYGFDNSETLENQPEITWMIFEDNAGVPAGDPETSPDSAVWTYSAAPNGVGVDITDYNILLDLDAAGESLELAPGTYWITVFPTYTNNILAQTDPRWAAFNGEPSGAAAHLISPSPTMFDVPEWTSLPDLGLTFSDIAFTIEGELQCGASWLSVDPASGSIAAGGSEDVAVTLDPTGLAPGVYEATLCIESNDTANPIVPVAVTFEVTAGSTAPTAVGAASPSDVPAGQSTLLTVTVTPGTLPASTGITVTGDLTAIGGSATQAFVDDGTGGDATAGDNVFSYTATVDADTAAGPVTIDVDVADAQARTATTTIALDVLAPVSEDPTAVGAASPSDVPAGQDTLLTVTVTPGTFPASTGITVTGDLTAIGGSATQAFVDDGTGGDATAGDNVFSYTATVDADTAAGSVTIDIDVADAQARTATTTIALDVLAPLPDAIFADGFED